MSGLQGRPGEQVTLMISQGLHRVEVGRGRSVSAGPLASVSTERRYKDTPIKYESAVSANRKKMSTLLSHPLSVFLFKKRQAPALQPRRMLLNVALELPGLFSPTDSNV